MAEHLGECVSCGESPSPLCSESKRGCGHHCNCSWVHDKCCWCGLEFGEEAQAPTSAQSSPDLEPVRRLILEIDREGPTDNKLAIAVHGRIALPALRSLLAEVEYCNSDTVKAHFKELNDDWIEMKAEVEKLRVENARWIAEYERLYGPLHGERQDKSSHHESSRGGIEPCMIPQHKTSMVY